METLLENIIKEWGFKDIEDFAKQKAIEVLEHKLTQYTKEIEVYETKYGMKLEEFNEKVETIKDKGIIEKEDDWMEWDGLVHCLNSVKRKIEKVKNINSIQYHSTENQNQLILK